MRTAPVGSVSDHRGENGHAKCPQSLCLMLALPSSGRRGPPPAGTLLPGHGSYGLIRRSRTALPCFGLSLVRGVSAGCYQPLLPAGPSRRYLCESFPGCLGPCHGGFPGGALPFLPPPPPPFPLPLSGSRSRFRPRNRFFMGCSFLTATLSL